MSRSDNSPPAPTSATLAHALVEEAFDALGEVCDKIDIATRFTVHSRPEFEALQRELARVSETFARARRRLEFEPAHGCAAQDGDS